MTVKFSRKTQKTRPMNITAQLMMEYFSVEEGMGMIIILAEAL